MRRLLIILVCVGTYGLSGCSAVRRAHEYQANGIKEYHDDWKIVGEEGRGELPREKETDWLTPFLESPQHRAINKNLGYD